jgi:polysaccharide biosynthesis transport protein
VSDATPVTTVQDYLAVIVRQRWVILLTIVLVAVAALGVTFVQTPLYRASTELALQPVSAAGGRISTGGAASETDQILLLSQPVTELAAGRLGTTPQQAAIGVSSEQVGTTSILRITAVDPDPATAAAKADAFAAAYLDFRLNEAVETVVSARASIEEQTAAVRSELAEIADRMSGAVGPEVEELRIQRTTLEDRLTQLIAQATEFTDATQGISGGGSVLTPASVPSSPFSPQPVRNLGLALVLGLVLGIAIAFVRNHVDDVVRDEDEFKRSTGGRPILGRIPAWNADADDPRLATVVDPSSLVAEAYRELSAGLRFMLVTHGADQLASHGTQPAGAGAVGAHPGLVGDDPAARPDARSGEVPRLGSAVMIASATAGEGKTSTAANLAVAAARVGLRTILVDADLRRSTVHRRFGLTRSTGLCDVLIGDGTVVDHLVDVGIENLRILPAGTVPPNPAELLASPAMRAVQYRLQRGADLVIYDSPAVLAVPDALELGRFVDLAILVGRAGVTTRRQLAASIERLTQVGTDIAGTVLNGITGRADGYYYAYYYAEEADGRGGRAGARSRRLLRRPRRNGRQEPTDAADGRAATGDGGTSEQDAAVRLTRTHAAHPTDAGR